MLRPPAFNTAPWQIVLAVILSTGQGGCTLPGSRRTQQVPPAPPMQAAPQVQTPADTDRAPAPVAETAVSPVRTASLAAMTTLQQAAPEPVPAPAPSSSLPLAFMEGATLQELEQIAGDNHPKLLAAIQEIEAAHGRAWQAGRMPNPTVGTSSPQLAASESQYNVFVSQEIPTGGKLRLNEAAAVQEIDQAELSLFRTRLDVLTGIRRHFYLTLVAQARTKILEEQVRTSARSVDLVRKRFEGTGEGTKTDVILLEVDLQKAEVALAGSQTDLEAQRRQLAAALGMPDYPLADVAGNLEAAIPLDGLSGLTERVVAGHAQTAIAATEIRRRRLLVDRAYAEPKPTFNVQGGYQRQVGPPQDQGLMQFTMSVPLWDRNHGGIQAAEAQATKAQAELSRIESDLASQAAAAYGRYMAAQQLVAKYRDGILPKTRESLALSTRLYQEGETDFQSLLHAQATNSEAQLKYLDALSALWEAAIEIADLLQMERFP